VRQSRYNFLNVFPSLTPSRRREQRVYHDVSRELLDRFQLSQDELRALQSPEITPSFFDVLKRAQNIQVDCQSLLRLPDARLGSQVSQSMGDLLETAYRKIYKWIREELQPSFELDAPDLHPLIAEALASLQDRAVLLSSCLEEIGVLRNRSIVRSFIDALTKGGPNGVPKPIEIHASDPRRYVGDMTAWLHQALASEHELATSLLRMLRKDRPDENVKLSGYRQLILSESFKDVCRPFRVRVDQVLTSPLVTAVTAFYLSNTFFFYSSRFAELAGQSSPIVLLADQCRRDCLSAFQSHFSALAERARRPSTATAIQDLSPSRDLLELFQILHDVGVICGQSLLPDSKGVSEFSPVLDSSTTLIIDVIKSNANAAKLTKLEEAIYSANCLHQAGLALSPGQPFSQASHALVDQHLKTHVDAVAQEQVASILRSCGMAPKLATVIHYQSLLSPQQKLSEVPGMEIGLVQSMFRSFETSLLDLGTFNLPILSKIDSADLRSSARTSVGTMIGEAYSTIYHAIFDSNSGYSEPETMARYKPDQVAGMIDL
jgi:conserved oligomeric Golgi complex subunit 6